MSWRSPVFLCARLPFPTARAGRRATNVGTLELLDKFVVELWQQVSKNASRVVSMLAEIIYRLLIQKGRNGGAERYQYSEQSNLGKGGSWGQWQFRDLGGQGHFEEFTNPKCPPAKIAIYIGLGSFGSKDPVNAKFSGSECRRC